VKPTNSYEGGQTASVDVTAAAPSLRGDEAGAMTRAAGILGLLTLLSRIAGLGRDVVIGAVFGTSVAADAFFVAFRIPNLFRRIVAEGAASTAFVPVFTAYRVEGGDRAAVRAASAVGGVAIVSLLGLVVLGVVLADPIVAMFAPGFADDPSKRELTVWLTAATFPYLLFVGVAAWAMGTLHTFRRFAAPAFGPVLLNLAIIVATLTLGSRLALPVDALVVGVLFGGFLQFAVQMPSLWRCGVRAGGLIHPTHPAVARVGRLLVPTILGGAVYQINILVATLFASLLPEGSVSWLWYADRVFEFPLGIIAVAVGTAALPSLSSQASAGRHDQMVRSIDYALRLVWSLCIPAMVGLWLLAVPIVTVLLQRGAFDSTDTAMTAWALRAYVFGLLGVASVRVLAAAFYALEKPRVPVFAASVALVVNAVCDLALMGPTDPTAPWWGAGWVAWLGDLVRVANLGHAGLALGTGVAASANAVLLFVFARQRLKGLAWTPLLRCFAVHGSAAAVMGLGLLAWGSYARAYGPYVELVGGIALGGAVYVPCALLLGSSEIRRLYASLLRLGR